ncbi:hypothetical protein D3C80_2089380 [compost metagenome]
MGMLLLPKELEPGKAANAAQRSDVKLYARQHLLKLKTDIEKLKASATGINKDHYESILIDIDKIITKLDKPTS